MSKIAVVVMLLSQVITMAVAQPLNDEPIQVEDWHELIGSGKEKVTQMHFYFHDTLSGKQPSAVKVAEADSTEKSPTAFGIVMMADDPLTEGPEQTSKLVGRAEGIYGSAGQMDFCLIMAMNFGFTDGKYNGSSLSIFGRNAALNQVRELPIVGGTGVFRMARGIAVAKTYWVNFTTGDAIVEYNITVVHY